MNLIDTLVNHFTIKGELRAPSLSEFVDFIGNELFHSWNNPNELFACILDYNDFLYFNNVLQLNHILPCDNEGNVLEEPLGYFTGLSGRSGGEYQKQFNQALKECVYAGFTTFMETDKKVILNNDAYYFHKPTGILVQYREDTSLETDLDGVGFLDEEIDYETHSDMVGQRVTPQYFIKALNLKQ